VDPDLEESALDLRRCAEIGRQLSTEREARALAIDDVAHDLLLSKRQIVALERAEPRVFHAPIYYVRALRKYCELLGLTPDRFEGMVTAPPEPERRAEGPRRGWGVAAVLLLVVIAAVVAGTWYVGEVVAPPDAVPLTAEPPVAPPSPEPLASPPPVVDDPPEDEASAPAPAVDPAPAPMVPAPVTPAPAPAPAPVASAATAGAGSVAVGRASWVFVRYPDNSTVERSITPGEAIRFRALPVYVAVGTTAGVTLMLGDRPVDVSPFISNGQVRLTREQIDALARRQ